jgi:hypothetical protein
MVHCGASSETPVVGLQENVRVDPGGLIFAAKLDTGADHSSIHAEDVSLLERDGETWVRFQLVTAEGRSVQLERKLVRLARIKKAVGKKKARPVVTLRICRGSISREIEVNLVDRSGFRNRMIIGRSFMTDALLVDPSRQFTAEPRCPRRPAE